MNFAVAALKLHQPLDMREDKSLWWIVWIGKVDLNLVAVLVGYGVEIGVAAAPVERRDHFVSLGAEQIDNLKNIPAIEDAGLHATSLSTRTGTSAMPSLSPPRICRSNSRSK